ncbi:MAG: PSD1 and planctomycete cytochrome C domain-containing protein [Bryobacterales bacterium]|nr:PSD1 and planctomycete cytochrome C domain-containing protein [Bryobacterales bacterium]
MHARALPPVVRLSLRLVAPAVSLSIASPTVLAQRPDEPRFEPHVAPILEQHCVVCHGETSPQAGLDVRTRGALLHGGKSGPAVVPGAPVDSLLLQKTSSGAMPMGGEKLASAEVDLIRRWIEGGALLEGEISGATGDSTLGQVDPRDILVTVVNVKCLLCHGRRRQEGGLDLRTREAALRGGASGPAIVPGDPDASLLIRRIAAEEMPPEADQARLSYRPVTSQELDKLREWISAGAQWDEDPPVVVDPDTDPLVSQADREFWAFRPPRRQSPPKVNAENRVRQPTDRFLLAKLEESNLAFSDDADRVTLVRRAYFDVTGLPPSVAEIDAFVADDSEDSYERLVDRLLESPAYGEHWGKRWLDAAGYADSEGQVDYDAVRPHAWRYRDWVIRALNSDKPYDEFLVEQIAGDELFNYRQEPLPLKPELGDKLVATGFMRMGPDGTYSVSQGFVAERLTVVADQLQILTSTVMGLTVACARCHDHKYDPIPQRDYYRLSAILRTAYDPYDWLSPSEADIGPDADWNETNTRLLPGAPAKAVDEVARHNAPIEAEIADLANKLRELPENVRRKLLEVPVPQDALVDTRKVLSDGLAPEPRGEDAAQDSSEPSEEARALLDALVKARLNLRTKPKVRAIFDMGGEPTPVHVLYRGEHRNPGPRVDPGVPSVLSEDVEPYDLQPLEWSSGRRLALARWLVQPSHPLTARVIVNRIWQHYFGRGIVESEGNFGRTGTPPTHPALLDWLAVEFVEKGWSLKALHRMILTSTAYRQSSRIEEPAQSADPENVFLSRFPTRRLGADAIRDSVLKVAQRLDPNPFGPPDEIEVKPDGEVVGKDTDAGQRRSIYVQQRRSRPITILESFDAPQLKPNCLRRSKSTVASQALQMMNSEILRANSRYMAGRVIDAVGEAPQAQVERVYLTALARRPTVEELAEGTNALGEMAKAWERRLDERVPMEPKKSKARWLALATLCHTVLNSAEFIYID